MASSSTTTTRSGEEEEEGEGEERRMEEERRVFDYFVVAGLRDKAETLNPSATECGFRSPVPHAPITDICVIFPSLGETVPDGFFCIENTPTGQVADLNHGSIRSPSCFLCYRRGLHKPALVDIGVLDEGRGERSMIDSHTLTTTPFGRPANVNNASQGIYLTYRRAATNTAPTQLVVTDICVILPGKGETPPHTFYRIGKNLNKGMLGSDVFVCYKKSQGTAKRLAYKPTVLDRFPKGNVFPLEQNIPLFCLPMGALIECWPANCQVPDKIFSTFVLTDDVGCKLYGASITFYEPYDGELTAEQLEILELTPTPSQSGAVGDNGSTNDPADQMSFHVNKAICVISKYPFFTAFKRFLYYLHRMSCTGTYPVPIERYISYFVPFPSGDRPRVLMQLGPEKIALDNQEESPLPLTGASFFDCLKCLGPDNLMYVLLLALLEQKVVLHSLRPWLLTAVAESVCALMFPFHWQCPYVPQCPLGMAGVLHAPLPFIAGVDSRYFELYDDPPIDVTCFDLDTATVSLSSIRQDIKLSMLPKKPAKLLRQKLEILHRRMCQEDFKNTAARKSVEFMPVSLDFEFQKRKKAIELSVQEAFLRFMASVMRGYTAHLKPIRSAPRDVASTDTGALFDRDGFLKSRDRTAGEFFRRFTDTQCFMRFIEERSFISDKNALNAFFDDCLGHIERHEDTDTTVLLDTTDTIGHSSSYTLVVEQPQPEMDSEGKEPRFEYDGFPQRLDPALFRLDSLNVEPGNPLHRSSLHEQAMRTSLLRTKQESRMSLKAVSDARSSDPLSWARSLFFFGYSVWFMQLPSLLHMTRSKIRILRLAFHVLHRIEQSKVIPLDQVCYRILIQCCGECEMPALALKVDEAMQRVGLEANALTYGIYHRAVLHSKWPSPVEASASMAWKRLWWRLRIVTQFRMAGHRRRGRNGASVPITTTTTDTQRTVNVSDAISESDGGYHSEATTNNNHCCPQQTPSLTRQEEEDEEEEEPQYFTVKTEEEEEEENISVSIEQMGSDDPLGVMSSIPQKRAAMDKTSPGVDKTTMSPSRARFLREHATLPFAGENEERRASVEEEESTPSIARPMIGVRSWLKGLTSSPLMNKMLRSQTVSDMDSIHSSTVSVNDSTLNVSPSLSLLVSEVTKHARSLQQGSNLSRLRSGVSALISEVAQLNIGMTRSDTGGSQPSLLDDEQDAMVDLSAPCFQLADGNPDQLLSADWWIPMEECGGGGEKGIGASTSNENGVLDVALCTCSNCPQCKLPVFDEEIMAGWAVNECNLNTTCPHCSHCFVPSLTITMTQLSDPQSTSWYPIRGTKKNTGSSVLTEPEENRLVEKNSVPLLSTLVLRKQLENLLSGDVLALADAGFRHLHPILFWNLLFYCHRLALPTHLTAWLGQCIHVRCTYDLADQHPLVPPLYLANPALHKKTSRQGSAWRAVVESLQAASVQRALHALVQEQRDGQKLRPHMPLFRDIQLMALQRFGRAVDRDQLEVQYTVDFERLPPRVAAVLPPSDAPPRLLTRACRKIFLPLDVI